MTATSMGSWPHISLLEITDSYSMSLQGKVDNRKVMLPWTTTEVGKRALLCLMS